MMIPSVIQFFIQNAEEGGYTASAVGYSIHTQGETLDEVARNIREAVECHFAEDEKKTVAAQAIPIMVNFAVPSFA